MNSPLVWYKPSITLDAIRCTWFIEKLDQKCTMHERRFFQVQTMILVNHSSLSRYLHYHFPLAFNHYQEQSVLRHSAWFYLRLPCRVIHCGTRETRLAHHSLSFFLLILSLCTVFVWLKKIFLFLLRSIYEKRATALKDDERQGRSSATLKAK